MTPTEPQESALVVGSEPAADFKKSLMDRVRAAGGTQAIDTKQLFQKLVKETLEALLELEMGVSLSGKQEVLGLWIEETESARFWLRVFNDLKARGVQDALIICGDGLTGLPNAVESVFPQADVQLCVVHHIRNVAKFVPTKIANC